MKILNDIPTQKLSNAELELVENEKQEYKFVGRYLRTKGLRLFAYRSLTDELKEVNITYKDSIHLIPDETNENLIPKDLGVEEASINSSDIHFEALNNRTAKNRVQKYKDGKIKDLSNLKFASKDGIKFY